MEFWKAVLYWKVKFYAGYIIWRHRHFFRTFSVEIWLLFVFVDPSRECRFKNTVYSVLYSKLCVLCRQVGVGSSQRYKNCIRFQIKFFLLKNWFKDRPNKVKKFSSISFLLRLIFNWNKCRSWFLTNRENDVGFCSLWSREGLIMIWNHTRAPDISILLNLLF